MVKEGGGHIVSRPLIMENRFGGPPPPHLRSLSSKIKSKSRERVARTQIRDVLYLGLGAEMTHSECIFRISDPKYGGVVLQTRGVTRRLGPRFEGSRKIEGGDTSYLDLLSWKIVLGDPPTFEVAEFKNKIKIARARRARTQIRDFLYLGLASPTPPPLEATTISCVCGYKCHIDTISALCHLNMYR